MHEGERLFNDTTLCHQRWQSCASCHPDGRTDGLNWDLLNDGIGNPKNTKSLLLASEKPPEMAQRPLLHAHPHRVLADRALSGWRDVPNTTSPRRIFSTCGQ